MSVGAAAAEGTLHVAVRRMTHEALLESKLIGCGMLVAWLEAEGVAADQVPVGEAIFACNVEVTGKAVLINPAPLEPDDVPPEPPCRLVILRPTGLLWCHVAEMRGGPTQMVVSTPETWFWHNRRTGRRIPLGQPGTIEVEGCRLSVTLEDISVSGARLSRQAPEAESDAPATPEAGGALRVLLPVGDAIWASAEVVRFEDARPGWHVLGVRWVDLPTAVDQRLVRFVFEREREQSGAPRRRR
jgi:hypothetical protein